ncbi:MULTISPECIES: TVP38/TMEM64 family protein [Paenibacillus]|uniref:TVP38/TMEM64 family protein n=1 Tax=Paenibacillus TaxID=44249 RepID=UPI0022B863B2|nr:TVP38/TMEM64 family protein [Paenibacillus caseinilyticus]MCZ8522055.1 TVP38/TMEM64 family protein [Paenibacillus caseinilyticus]
MKMLRLALVLAAAVSLWLINHYYFHFTPQGVRDAILSFGIWAPLIYIAVYTVRPLFFFPATVLCLAGGLAFGPLWGTFYTILGFTGDSMLVFLLARRYGTRFIRPPEGNIRKWQERLARKGFLAVASLRLIPVVPFDLISFAAGLSPIRFLPYLAGTVLGTIPVTFAYSFLGDRLSHGLSPALLPGLAAVLLLAVIPVLLVRRRSAR